MGKAKRVLDAIGQLTEANNEKPKTVKNERFDKDKALDTLADCLDSCSKVLNADVVDGKIYVEMRNMEAFNISIEEA